jgi:hypothetical protein
MDFKSMFLNGNLEEVYIEQPKGFQLPEKQRLCIQTKASSQSLAFKT